MVTQHPSVRASNATPPEQAVFVDASVREALSDLRNGQVTITVHNGEIVQIDRILRKRQFKSKPQS